MLLQHLHLRHDLAEFLNLLLVAVGVVITGLVATLLHLAVEVLDVFFGGHAFPMLLVRFALGVFAARFLLDQLRVVVVNEIVVLAQDFLHIFGRHAADGIEVFGLARNHGRREVREVPASIHLGLVQVVLLGKAVEATRLVLLQDLLPLLDLLLCTPMEGLAVFHGLRCPIDLGLHLHGCELRLGQQLCPNKLADSLVIRLIVLLGCRKRWLDGWSYSRI
mmetsp:Transcript_3047/g.6500  ORF Transcript_3047/g.6500 Transcript_3047/m.6500 type:complete len:220 (+) Transcript_3047:457-1116(+)